MKTTTTATTNLFKNNYNVMFHKEHHLFQSFLHLTPLHRSQSQRRKLSHPEHSNNFCCWSSLIYTKYVSSNNNQMWMVQEDKFYIFMFNTSALGPIRPARPTCEHAQISHFPLLIWVSSWFPRVDHIRVTTNPRLCWGQP
jgi:hypothetical protein